MLLGPALTRAGPCSRIKPPRFVRKCRPGGVNNFGLISRMLTDWAAPLGAVHRRLETRWVKPVKPGDTIQPSGIVKSTQATANSRWVLIDVIVRNQTGEKVATGEAMVEFPR